jgi:hypothetical protein
VCGLRRWDRWRRLTRATALQCLQPIDLRVEPVTAAELLPRLGAESLAGSKVADRGVRWASMALSVVLFVMLTLTLVLPASDS